MPVGGENSDPADPQPGGRAPAPGRLALVQAFVNSNYDLEHSHGAELFADPGGLRLWLDRRGLLDPAAGVTSKDLDRALAIRAGLRALLVANNGGERDDELVSRLDAETRRLPIALSLPGGAPSLGPYDRGVDGALAAVMAVTVEAMLDGSWQRLKACRQHDCRWAFYDHSRNGASSWCSMRVCGGRAKARAYYRRRR